MDEQVEVLIVGGGGAGLTASMLLARLGVDALLVSAQAETSRLPKAHVLNQRAMEIMRDCGTADDIYAIGTPPEAMSHTAYYAGFAGRADAGAGRGRSPRSRRRGSRSPSRRSRRRPRAASPGRRP